MGRGHPKSPPLPQTEDVPAKKVVGGLGQDHPLNRQVGGWEDEPLTPLEGGSAPGSNQEVSTTFASGQAVNCLSPFPTSCGHYCQRTSKAQPGQTLEGVVLPQDVGLGDGALGLPVLPPSLTGA